MLGRRDWASASPPRPTRRAVALAATCSTRWAARRHNGCAFVHDGACCACQAIYAMAALHTRSRLAACATCRGRRGAEHGRKTGRVRIARGRAAMPPRPLQFRGRAFCACPRRAASAGRAGAASSQMRAAGIPFQAYMGCRLAVREGGHACGQPGGRGRHPPARTRPGRAPRRARGPPPARPRTGYPRPRRTAAGGRPV